MAFSRNMEPYEMYEIHCVFNGFSGGGRHLGGIWEAFGGAWEAFGGILEALGGSWVAFGTFWRHLETPWRLLGDMAAPRNPEHPAS